MGFDEGMIWLSLMMIILVYSGVFGGFGVKNLGLRSFAATRLSCAVVERCLEPISGLSRRLFTEKKNAWHGKESEDGNFSV